MGQKNFDTEGKSGEQNRRALAGAGFAPCFGVPLGKPPAGQRQRRFSPRRPDSALGMQGAKPLA